MDFQDRDTNNQSNNSVGNGAPAPQRMKWGIVFLPLILNYAVSFIVQIAFCGTILFGVVSNYIYASPEFEVLIENMESDTSLSIADSVEELMTDEVMEAITLESIEVIENNLALLTILSAVASIPVFLGLMYRDKKKRVMPDAMEMKKAPVWHYGFIVVGSAMLCLALNNLLTLSQLSQVSQAYQESSESLYSISFPLQIIGLGILVPIAEEVLFRGVLYKRLRVYLRPLSAMLWSAIIFGAYHGNIVQLIYAFACGMLLAWSYEKFGTIKAPILGHICMNMTSLILTQYNFFVWMFQDPIRMTVITVVSATMVSICYVVYTNITNKNLESQ